MKPNRCLAAAVALGVWSWALVTWWPHVRNEFFVVLGNRDESGGWYGWWSGNAGGLQIFQWLAIAMLLYWHHTCQHSLWCLRPGKYEAAGGVFKLCHRHHPDLLGTRPHRDLIRQLHHEWRQGGRP